MGKVSTIFSIVLSLLIAVGGSYFLYKRMTPKKKPPEAVEIKDPDKVEVVVVKEDFPWGTKLTSELLTRKTFLKKSLPMGYFKDPLPLENRIAISSFKKGDLVVEHRLAPTDIKVGGVSVVLDSGKRAIAVKGNKVIGISGFVKPGNRLDVLVTIREPEKKIDITKIVLENILVLASGTQIQDNGKGEPSPVAVYTLEVTPEQGERLTLAATKGRLQFALRGMKDGDPVPTKGITIPELLASKADEDVKPEKQIVSSKPEPKKPGPRKKVKKKQYRKPPAKATIVTMKGLEIMDKISIKL